MDIDAGNANCRVVTSYINSSTGTRIAIKSRKKVVS